MRCSSQVFDAAHNSRQNAPLYTAARECAVGSSHTGSLSWRLDEWIAGSSARSNGAASGRIGAGASSPSPGTRRSKGTFYFGGCAGGVWKTTNGGAHWENVSDGYFKTAAIGALAVSDSDPNVIYAGIGEATIRGNVSHGDGVYKSSDGGAHLAGTRALPTPATSATSSSTPRIPISSR